MEPYTWDEIAAVWEEAADDKIRRVNLLSNWIKGFPRTARRAAGLALSLIKWDETHFATDLRGSIFLCGVCQAQMLKQVDPPNIGFMCDDCPLTSGPSGNGCDLGHRKNVYNFILEKYREEYERLPARWR